MTDGRMGKDRWWGWMDALARESNTICAMKLENKVVHETVVEVLTFDENSNSYPHHWEIVTEIKLTTRAKEFWVRHEFLEE